MNIGVWGDSMVYGQSDEAALGWVGRLRLSYPYEEYVIVYNRGVCGNTSRDVLKRFATEAVSISPELIIFAVGINDTKYPPGEKNNLIALQEFVGNMRMLCMQAKTHTNKIFAVSLTKVDETRKSTGARYVNRQIQRYNEALKDVCNSEGVTYIDVYNVMDEQADLLRGFHPNAVGYEKLAAVIKSAIQ